MQLSEKIVFFVVIGLASPFLAFMSEGAVLHSFGRCAAWRTSPTAISGQTFTTLKALPG